MNAGIQSLIRGLSLLAAVGMSFGCSADADSSPGTDALGGPEAAENTATSEEAIAEAACFQDAPDATLSPFGKGASQFSQSPTSYGTPIGVPGCSLAWKVRARPSGVVQSRLQVQTTVAPSPAECTRTGVRAIVYRNGVFQRDLNNIGTLSGGVCNKPSVGDIFNFGDGADWRVIVQARVQLSTRSVKTTLTNQQQ